MLRRRRRREKYNKVEVDRARIHFRYLLRRYVSIRVIQMLIHNFEYELKNPNECVNIGLTVEESRYIQSVGNVVCTGCVQQVVYSIVRVFYYLLLFIG